jgi:hypothetical protein
VGAPRALPLSAPAGPVWPTLREAARAFCPPLEVATETPQALSLVLDDPDRDVSVKLRYRSERSIFLRTYYLVMEADVPGAGPDEAGQLVLRRRGLAWKRPKPRAGKAWSKRLASDDIRGALRALQVERLAIAWAPQREMWTLSLETLSGSLTVTFFPALSTPNPLHREEAQAFLSLRDAVRAATSGRPA